METTLRIAGLSNLNIEITEANRPDVDEGVVGKELYHQLKKTLYISDFDALILAIVDGEDDVTFGDGQ